MRDRSRIGNVRGLLAALGAVAIMSICAGGCYERVVGAEGPGADSYDIYQPNLKSTENSAFKRPSTVPNKTVPTKKAKD